MSLKAVVFLLVISSAYGKSKHFNKHPKYTTTMSPSRSVSSSNSSLSASVLGLCGAAGWSDSDRQGIINNHNTLRSKISKGTYVAKTDKKPPATDMEMMTYDCNLEASAQSWASKCPTGHSGTAGVGENIYWSWSSAPISISGKGEVASAAWQNEFQQYGWPSNTLTLSLFNSGIGHATQMAWWNSNRIGCGVQQCPSTQPGFPYEIVVVC